MRKYSILFIGILISLAACKGKKGTEEQQIATEEKRDIVLTEDDIVIINEEEIEYDGPDAGYVSTIEYFEDQWEYRKGQPYTIRKTTTINNHVDSIFVGLDDLLWQEMIQKFVEADINDPKFKGKYSFEVVEDDLLPVYTFIYTARDETLDIKNTTLTLNKMNNRIESIYIEKNYKKNNETFEEKLLYITGNVFQVHEVIYRDGKVNMDRKVNYAFKF